MRILDRLFGRRADPTKDWPAEEGEAPECDLSRMAFGPLCFGSPIEAARCFGRPDRFRWKTGDYCELLYARAGFQLDFEEGRLAYVAFFIGEDESSSLHPTAATAQPRIRGGARLTSQVGRQELLDYFGVPVSEESSDDEAILYYGRGVVTMECELDANGHLKRWNLYPSNDVA